MRKCTFIGHSDATDLEEKIEKAIKSIMVFDIEEFVSGGMGNFDKMCERVVKKLGYKLVYVPYNASQIKEEDKKFYDEIIPYNCGEYKNSDIPMRNKMLVDTCDFAISYVHRNGGAKNTYDYAIREGIYVDNIKK